MDNAVTSKELIVEKIQACLNSVRFYVNRDGGDLEFIDFKEGIVYIRILGACVGCSLSPETYKSGVAGILKLEIPEVIAVEIEEGDNFGLNPLF